jgi:hypothetical protein
VKEDVLRCRLALTVPRICIVLFFLFYLSVGFSVYKDYGISWDEPIQRDSGIISAKYLTSLIVPSFNPPEYSRVPSLRECPDCKYGIIFDSFMYFCDVLLGYHDNMLEQCFYFRHLCTFLLFFVSTIFFFLILNNRFNNWMIGLTGTLFLMLSPRIFADSFYNDKDIVFLSFFIIAIYFFIQFLNTKTHMNSFLFALSSALMVDTRITGVFVPFLAVIMSLLDFIKAKPNSFTDAFKGLIPLFTYLAYCLILMVFFWPYLWENPVRNFIDAFLYMAKYPWPYSDLYMGTFIKATSLPWHYIPVWILVTTPIMYTVFFLFGTFWVLRDTVWRGIKLYCNENERQDFLFLLLFIAPIVTVIILKSTLYNGWRQMYFSYVPFILIAVKGFVQILGIVKRAPAGVGARIASGLVGFIILGLIATSYQMIRSHPFQNVYFNLFAGNNIRQKFDLDYWGLSYRKALQDIVNEDKRAVINLAANSTVPLLNNALLLKEEDVRRLKLTDVQHADYFLTAYESHPQDYQYTNEIYKIVVNNTKIMSVFKLR